MDLIVDANIIFACLIRQGTTVEIIAEPDIHLFAPEFLIEEIEKHLEKIISKTNLSKNQLEQMLDRLQERIIFIPLNEFESFLKEADEFSPDPGDVPYLALALKLKIPIWSNDRKLKSDQKTVKVYTTHELVGQG